MRNIMKKKEEFTENVLESLSKKDSSLKPITLAPKILKELEINSLDHILAEHLPATDVVQRENAAKGIQQGISEMYENLGTKLTNTDFESFLNKNLDGHSYNEQGKFLVNLLNCSISTKHDEVENNPRWKELQKSDTFQQQDISDLMNMVKQVLDNNASLLVRQEFLVMEHALGKLPNTMVEAQMNSGSKYATAYAAAMYIISNQTDSYQDLSPYNMGVMAAKSVESSRILAMYHYGKLKLEEAMDKLHILAVNMLSLVSKYSLSVLAFSFRLGTGFAVYNFSLMYLDVLTVTNTVALFIIPLLVALMIFIVFDQEKALDFATELTTALTELATDIWNSVKNFIHNINKDNDDDNDPPAPAEAITIDDTQEDYFEYTPVDTITV